MYVATVSVKSGIKYSLVCFLQELKLCPDFYCSPAIFIIITFEGNFIIAKQNWLFPSYESSSQRQHNIELLVQQIFTLTHP